MKTPTNNKNIDFFDFDNKNIPNYQKISEENAIQRGYTGIYERPTLYQKECGGGFVIASALSSNNSFSVKYASLEVAKKKHNFVNYSNAGSAIGSSLRPVENNEKLISQILGNCPIPRKRKQK